jgi:hypothetical protein
MQQSQKEKTSFFLLFPWGLVSIIIILLLSTFLSGWVGNNWSWIALLLIVPTAIFENLKVGYSTQKVMFTKIVFTAISFMIVGFAFGLSAAGWYYENYKSVIIPRMNIPWYVLLSIIIILIIQIVHIYTLLKAVRREFMQYDPGS